MAVKKQWLILKQKTYTISYFVIILNNNNMYLGKTFCLIALLIILLFANGGKALGQKTWDGGGDGVNWSSGNNWNPNGVPLNTDDVIINSGSDLSVTVDVAAVCNSLILNQGARNITLTISGINSLTVGSSITMNAPTGGTRNTLLAVGTGTLNCASVSSNNSGNDNRDNVITLSSGSINVTGNFAMGANANQNSITCTSSGVINVSGSFTTGTFTCGTGTVNYEGTGAQTITGYNYYNLTTSSARTTNNITLVNAGTIGVAGSFTPSATFTTGGYVITNNTVNFNATSSQTIPAFNYYNLTISGARTTNSVTLANSGIIGIAGTFNPSATFTTGGFINTGSTLDFNGSGAQTVPAFNYNNLTISGARTTNNVTLVNGGTIAVSGNYSPAATFTTGNYVITNNTINYNGTNSQTVTAFNYNNLTISGARTNNSIILANSGTIGIASVFNTTATFTTGGYTTAGSTVNYNGAGAQNIINTFDYNNLNVSNANTKTASGNVNVLGDINIANNVTLSLGTAVAIWNVTGTATVDGTLDFGATIAKTFNLASDLINVTGTITMTGAGLAHSLNLGGVNNAITTFNTTASSGSTVSYSRTGDQQVFASANYRNLIISNGGNKTLQGSITIADVLTLNSGVINLGDYNLTLSNNAANAVQGTPGSTSMVESNGTGDFIRNAAATLPIAFPVGSGGYYSPVSITAKTGSTGTFRVKAVPSGALGSKYVSKYWDVLASAAGNILTVIFQYDPAEITVTPTNIWVKPGAGNWQVPAGTQSFGANTFTITGTNNITTTTSSWTAGALGTYYSYQTGDWNTPDTWTSDPGGTTQVGTTVPGIGDAVIILDGRTVSLPANITTSGLEVKINSGGILDMVSFAFTAPLSKLDGQGTLRLSSSSFPTVTTNTFVLTGGGTTVYYNVSDFTLPAAQAVYNNLQIDAPGVIATQFSDITLNGDLHIKQGTFRINNDASTVKRNLIINGNVTVDANAFVTVGKGATNTTTDPLSIGGGAAPYTNYYEQFHRVVIYGNLTNNGTVRFTNLAYPVYNAFPTTVSGSATAGGASVYFRGTTDNTLYCNNTTDFYNLILDKGSDQTYKLTIQPTAYGNFRLFGANIAGGENGTSNPNLRKALWIRTGTLVLKGMAVIPSLTEGAAGGNPVSDYVIPANGAMVLNGTEVVILSTSDDYREVNAAYGVAGGSGSVNGVNVAVNPQGLLLYGKLQVNNGYLSTRESAGILYSNIGSGQFEMNGGTVDSKQYREYGTTGSGASFVQNGGLMLLRGRFVRTPVQYNTASDLSNSAAATLNTARLASGTSSTQGTLNINNASNVFSMSGGTIRIYDACGTAAPIYAIDLRSSSANNNVTGGTIEILPTTGTGLADASPQLIYSMATSLGNLTINRGVGCTSDVQLDTYPLIVLRNLDLQSGTFLANNYNVSVGGNFNVATGSTYNSGINSTTFNGSIDQYFTISGTVNNGAAGLRNLVINKSSGSLIMDGNQASLTVQDIFNLTSGTLDDGGKIIYVGGNLTNSGTHISTPGNGKIQLNGTAVQTVGGNGNGVFNHIELNNTNTAAAPVSITANMTINGVLTFSQDKLLNVSTYNLKLNSGASIANAGANRYVLTSGTAGDGGLTFVYPSASAFTFPVGTVSTRHTTNPYYTPATIGFSGTPTTLGSVTVIPVGYEHPNTTSKGRSLTYFWRVRSAGFALGSATVSQGFTYNQNDVVTAAGITEDEYVAARYNSSGFTWSKGTISDVDETNNIAGEPGTGTFLESVSFIDGDYTAGDDNPTNPFGAPTLFYSRQSGLWSNFNTWSYTGHSGPSTGGAVPGANDIVIIGGNDSINLATNNTIPNTDVRSCASLQIEQGSALDIGYNPGCTFSMVQSHPNGNGNFRLTTSWNDRSTFTFPSGDFSDFNINLGTTELYSTNPGSGTTYYLPNGITTYGNLILSPLGGSNIIFPNNNLTIYGDCITRGQNADSWFCPTWDGNYPTAPAARIAKTITINGDLNIQGGGLVWYGNGAITQNIVVNGDVFVAPLACIDVWSLATSQSLSIGGSLVNNTSNTTPLGTSTPCRCDFTLLPVTFFGNNSAFITNTTSTPLTIFETLIINKGSSQATSLTCNIGGTMTLPANNWITLQNGTFEYVRTGDLPVTTTSTFTIPGTAGLYINTPSNVYIARSNSNTNDLYLNGKLTILGGNVYIGREAGTDNNNNDIEYSGGGLSEIDIRGGSLMVNGQVRRNPAMSNGILKYSQSGNSIVTINGQNAITTNAKLEILNSGSTFNMSGNAVLTIVRGGGGTAYGDLFLRPGSSSVTGGTIVLSHNISGGSQSYLLDANVPLNNLTITGRTAATAANALVNLMVNPLVMNGTLFLSNINSILNANNINVTIKGDLTNNGNTSSYVYGTNTTAFNGNVQAINGSAVTNFYNLTVSPVTSLTLSQNTTVNNELTLGYGTLICGNNAVNVKNNITNNATYTDTQYGIILNGATVQQKISGTGTFGRLEINNALGAKIMNDVTLQSDLVLSLGILDINQYLLTLGQNSVIGGGPFSSSKMITSDGVYSNIGIRKFFNTGATTFIYPLGVSGKYTPADLNISANGSVGYIRINGINGHHPAVLNPAEVLNYYWEVESSGITGFAGTMLFNYLQSDVQGARENEYVAARLIVPPSTSWSKATAGSGTDNVDETGNQITFTFPAGTSSLGGEYTAGVTTAIPDNIPVYQSISDGDWTDKTIWQPVAPTVDPCPDGGPNGYIVIINNNVVANADNCFAYRTTINDELRIDAGFSGHNLGIVSGNGTLILENGILPAGRFSSFFDCAGNGILEYGGSGNYTIIADRIDNVPNLFFSGTGTRNLPNKDLTVCHEMRINGPAVNNSISNRKLTMLGAMNLLSGSFNSGTGNGATVSFAGTGAQTLSGFTGSNTLNNLEINNTAGLTFTGSNDVKGNLLLTNGIIHTTSANPLNITNTAINCVIPSGGSSASFIDGPMIKRIFTGESFQYPLGKATTLGNKLSLSATQGGSGYVDWTAEFFTPNTYTTFNAPLSDVNNREYWVVSALSGSAAIVSLAWDPQSNLTPLMTQNGLPDMRVADHDGSNWNQISSTATGDDYNGYVSTSSRVSIPVSGSAYYAIGCVNTIKPKATLSPVGPVCGMAGIPVTFTSPNPAFNYSLAYKYNGAAQTPVTLSSLPYVLPTDAAGGTYQLTGFTYNNGVGNGVVDPAVITTYAAPTTANAGSDIATCGVTSTTLAGNNPIVGTGLWTIINGTGGTLAAPANNASGFSGVYGSAYTLRWTISNGTCTSSDEMNVQFNISPTQPSTFTTYLTPVCQGQNDVIYTVPNDVNATSYNWSYSGAGADITGTGNSVSIDFSSSATSGTLSVSTTNGCGTSTALDLAITVNASPTISLGTDPSVCRGITIAPLPYTATTGSPDQYSIVYDAGALSEGFVNITNFPLGVSPINLVVPGAATPNIYDADLTVRNSTSGCISIIYPITVTVNPLPSVTNNRSNPGM